MGKRDTTEDAELFYTQSIISSMVQGQPSQLIYDVTHFAGTLFKKLHNTIDGVDDNVMGGMRIALENNRQKYKGDKLKEEFCDRLEKLLNAVEAYHLAYQEFDDWTTRHEERLTAGYSPTN